MDNRKRAVVVMAVCSVLLATFPQARAGANAAMDETNYGLSSPNVLEKFMTPGAAAGVEVRYSCSVTNEMTRDEVASRHPPSDVYAFHWDDGVHTWQLTYRRATYKQLTGKNEVPRRLTVFFHGNGQDIGTVSLAPMAAMFHSDVIAVDYPGYGQCSGMATQTNIDTVVSRFIDTLTRHVHATDMVFAAHSIGTGISTQIVAKLRLKIAGLVLLSPYTKIDELTRWHATWMVSMWVSGGWWDSASHIQNVNCPVYIAHGVEDSIIPVEMGKSVYAACVAAKGEQNCHLHLLNDGDKNVHNSMVGDIFSRHATAHSLDLKNWVDRMIGAPPMGQPLEYPPAAECRTIRSGGTTYYSFKDKKHYYSSQFEGDARPFDRFPALDAADGASVRGRKRRQPMRAPPAEPVFPDLVMVGGRPAEAWQGIDVTVKFDRTAVDTRTGKPFVSGRTFNYHVRSVVVADGVADFTVGYTNYRGQQKEWSFPSTAVWVIKEDPACAECRY